MQVSNEHVEVASQAHLTKLVDVIKSYIAATAPASK
jgi:hypothetical protein